MIFKLEIKVKHRDNLLLSDGKLCTACTLKVRDERHSLGAMEVERV